MQLQRFNVSVRLGAFNARAAEQASGYGLGRVLLATGITRFLDIKSIQRIDVNL